MMAIDVSFLMHDPDFAFPYIVERSSGRWDKGRFISSTEQLKYYGPVQPANEKDMEQIPEGDRQKGIMKFFCRRPKQIYLSRDAGDDTGICDCVIWEKRRYKIMMVKPWDHYGWQRAFGYLVSPTGEDSEGG